MQKITALSAIGLFVLLPVTQNSFAADSAIGTMAEIVINLKHFPSDSDKERLSTIVDGSDSSEAEVAVATAIANIEHQAKAADKEKLSAIVADESAPAQLRDVASVVLALNHMANESDIAMLEKIAP